LRGIEKVSKGNRRIIIEKAKQLGYPVKNNPVVASQGEGSLIALIVGFHVGEFYGSFFNGFIDASQKRDLSVSMFNAPSSVDEICSLIERLDNAGYSSAVLMISTLRHKDYQHILEHIPKSFPLVSCSNIIHPVLSTVTFDAYMGGSIVADHFVNRGYKTVGFIEGPSNKPGAQYRKNGFVDTINNTSDATFLWSHEGDYSIRSGIKAFNDFKELDSKPRAIFAADDATAVGFMESARARGYDFPADIALAGYDNLPICDYHFPKVTSVKTNFSRLASVAFNVLEEQSYRHINHEGGLVSMLPVELIVRQSS
jgi:DNA-binding LacI/PurR family transcriptional regulator